MRLSLFSANFLRLLLVILFFVSPLIFFTGFTRNPYFFQITLVNISIAIWLIVLSYEIIKNGEIKIKISPFHYLFLLMILVFFITSLYAYFFHLDFYKPSIINENKRIWFFTIVNAFLPFFIFSQYNGWMPKTDKSFPYSLFFILSWGIGWFLFKIFKISHPFFDIYGFIMWLWAIIYLYSKTEINYYNIIHLAMLSGFYASIYGVFQYFGIEIIWDKNLTPYGRRAVTTFGNPNFASSYVLMLIPFSLFYYSKVKEKIRNLYLVFLVSFIMMIFASLTRSTMIGLIVEVLILAYFSFKNFIISKREFKKIIILILLIAIIWPDQDLNFFKSGVLKRFYEAVEKTSFRPTLFTNEKDIYQSFHQRLLIWKCGIDMFFENPVFGKGWGNFELFYPFYQAYYLRINPALKSLRTHANNAHNEVIEILSQTGIIGMGFFLLLIISFTVHVLKNYRLYKDDYLVIISVSLLAMFIDNILNVSIHFAVPGLLFFSILGISASKISKEIIFKTNVLSKSFLIILIILSLLYVYQWKNYLYREVYYFQGFKEMRKGNYHSAKNYLYKAVNYHKWEVNTTYELANSYVKNAEFDNAIAAYKDALNSNAGYDEIYFNLGIVERNLLKFEQAKKHLLMSIWINPFNEKAYYAYAEIILRQPVKNDDQLRFIFEDAIKNHPYDGYIYWLYGYFYDITGNAEMAKRYYKSAVLNDPSNLQYIISLKKFLSHNDSIFLLLDLYKKVVIENKYDKKFVEKAIKELENFYSSNIKFKFLKAKYLYDIGNYIQSEEILKEIIETDYSFYPALRAIALVHEKINDYSNAVYYYTKYLEFDPSNNDVKARIDHLKRMK